MAEIVPATTVTQHGLAAATFRARTAGQVTVQVIVEEQLIPIEITVLGASPRF